MDKLRSLLDRALGPSKVLTSPDACLAYAGDDSDQEPVAPDAVVLASSADDIAKAVRAASEAEVPIVPRAGGSGKSGGCVPVAGGVVIATLGMNAIQEISREEQVAVVQPGVILGDLHAAVEAEGMFFPPDPNSLRMCALGGNIAENAAGPRAFKYGSTRDYVLGLEVVLVDGTQLRTGKRTVKGVTGYDVTSLLVGSEGTLAITTAATLRLIPKPHAVTTLLALFPDVQASGRAVSAMIAAGVRPRCIELLDEGTLDAVRVRGVAVDERARAMLIIEVDGEPSDCDAQAERIGEVCAAEAIDILVAQDAAQRDRLWEARRQLSPATRAMARFKISEDVVVPRDRIPALLEETRAIERETGVRMITYGHAGDGNLHVNLLWNDEELLPRVEEALNRLFLSVVGMRGTLTGEHGVGTSKADFLAMEQQPELIALQKRIKGVFDPKGLLNPHKIFPRRQLEAASVTVAGRAVSLHGAC
ncbi:FAD-binding protein [Chondromyces crocatus]|uniref:FAD-binding protein n=1 Tax=Chondromyces crocatus TaxID=52 RepID=A0A0K1EMU2_CHOCO|nr:FAD-binding protein [Chondromyces crocatus]